MESLNGNWVRILVCWGIISFYTFIFKYQMKICSNRCLDCCGHTLVQMGVHPGYSARFPRRLFGSHSTSDKNAIGHLGPDSWDAHSNGVRTSYSAPSLKVLIILPYKHGTSELIYTAQKSLPRYYLDKRFEPSICPL
jgi:hypothetical protein